MTSEECNKLTIILTSYTTKEIKESEVRKYIKLIIKCLKPLLPDVNVDYSFQHLEKVKSKDGSKEYLT